MQMHSLDLGTVEIQYTASKASCATLGPRGSSMAAYLQDSETVDEGLQPVKVMKIQMG